MVETNVAFESYRKVCFKTNKKGFDHSNDRFTSLIEIEDQFGFYDGIYYNPETYIGRLYSEETFDYTYIDSNLTEIDTVATNYLPNVLQSLEKEDFIFSNKVWRRDSNTQRSFFHNLLGYTIRNSEIDLFNNDEINASLWIVANSYDKQEDVERRMMLLLFLTHPVSKSIGGLSLETICHFFRKICEKKIALIN